MGGGSSSRSASTTNTTVTDNRIAATEDAIVARDNANAYRIDISSDVQANETTRAAIMALNDINEAAFGMSEKTLEEALEANRAVTEGSNEIAEFAISSNTGVLSDLTDTFLDGLEMLYTGTKDTTAEALETVSKNADQAFNFVQEARKEADERNFQKALPWIVGGASAVAILMATRK